jgi:hypothetical protein
MFSQFQQHVTALNCFAKVETNDLSHSETMHTLECIRLTLATLTKMNEAHILELTAKKQQHIYEPTTEMENPCIAIDVSPLQYDDLADYALEEYSYSIPESQRYGEPLGFSSVSPENIDDLSEITSPTFVSRPSNQYHSHNSLIDSFQSPIREYSNIGVEAPCPNVTIRRNKQWNRRTIKTREPEHMDKPSNFIPFADHNMV